MNRIPPSTNLSPDQLHVFADLIAARVADKLRQQPKLVSKRELAKIINLSATSIERLMRSHKIPVIRLGTRVLFNPDAVADSLSRLQSLPESTEV